MKKDEIEHLQQKTAISAWSLINVQSSMLLKSVKLGGRVYNIMENIPMKNHHTWSKMHKVARTSFETILSMFCCFHRASLQENFHTDSNEIRNHGTLDTPWPSNFWIYPQEIMPKISKLGGEFWNPLPKLGFCEKDSKVGIETASGKSVEGTYYGCLRRTIAPINHSRTSQKPQHKYLQENHQKRQEMRVFEGRNLGDES